MEQKFTDPTLQRHYEDLCVADPTDYEFRAEGRRTTVSKFRVEGAYKSLSISGRLTVPITLRDGKKGSVFWPEEFSSNLFRKEPKQSEARHIEFNSDRTQDALAEYNMSIANTSDKILITCGCRDFTIEEARKHWAEDNISQWSRYTYEWGAIRRMQVEVLVQKARDAGWDVPEETKEEDPYDPELWEFTEYAPHRGEILAIHEVGSARTITYRNFGGVEAVTISNPSNWIQRKKPKPEEVRYNITFCSETHGMSNWGQVVKDSLQYVLDGPGNGGFISAHKVEKFNGEWATPVSLTLEELKAEAA